MKDADRCPVRSQWRERVRTRRPGCVERNVRRGSSPAELVRNIVECIITNRQQDEFSPLAKFRNGHGARRWEPLCHSRCCFDRSPRDRRYGNATLRQQGS